MVILRPRLAPASCFAAVPRSLAVSRILSTGRSATASIRRRAHRHTIRYADFLSFERSCHFPAQKIGDGLDFVRAEP
jgi:hypothetical protein